MILDSTNNVISYTKNPAKIAMAVVRDAIRDRHNLITLEWFMRTSIEPAMFAISIGHNRYSHECLQNFRYFNLCFPSPEQVKEVIICGTRSGRDIDKFALENLTHFPGKLAKLPILRNAAANFECLVTTQVGSGDHTIFVGEVKYAWFDRTQRVICYEDLKT